LPITQELGIVARGDFLVFSLARAEGAIDGPLTGYLIDRFGPRPMMLAGVILSGVSYMLLAGVESYHANIPLLTIRKSPVRCSCVESRVGKEDLHPQIQPALYGNANYHDDASQTEPLTH
jgi:hypothetical protein